MRIFRRCGANMSRVSIIPVRLAALLKFIHNPVVFKSSRAVDISPHLFCTRRGKSYFNESNGRTEGWDSMWQRFMARILKETKVSERFTEHDLRAKCASDADTLEHAQSLLSHTDSKITKAVYRRKPEIIKPSKSSFE